MMSTPRARADIRYCFSLCPNCKQVWQNIDYGCARHQLTCGYPLPARNQAEIEYGSFRVIRGAEVLQAGGMNEGQATDAAEIAGASIEHLNPTTGEWRQW